jgi:hypothetical protein
VFFARQVCLWLPYLTVYGESGPGAFAALYARNGLEWFKRRTS